MENTTSAVPELLQAIGWLLSSGWTALTTLTVPGLGCSFATLFVGLFLAELGLRFLGLILGVNIGSTEAERFGSVLESRHMRKADENYHGSGSGLGLRGPKK